MPQTGDWDREWLKNEGYSPPRSLPASAVLLAGALGGLGAVRRLRKR